MDAALESFNADAFRYLVFSHSTLRSSSGLQRAILTENQTKALVQHFLQTSDPGLRTSNAKPKQLHISESDNYAISHYLPSHLLTFEPYFNEAQHRCQNAARRFALWYNDCGGAKPSKQFDWPRDVVHPVDALVDHDLKRCFQLPADALLLATSALTNISLLPDPAVQQYVARKRVCEALQEILDEAQKRSDVIPDFQTRLQSFRQHCGDEIVVILEDINESGATETVSNVIRSPGGLTDDEINRQVAQLAPSYMIVHEFVKEFAIVFFVVDYNMELKRRAESSQMKCATNLAK
jgi:hypothetical protein